MDVEEVVGDFVSLKKKGQNLWACCPFHDEKTPSFSVSPAKGFYKCFGCGKAGDAISFVMELEGLSFSEAIKYLAKKYGIEILETEQTDEQIEAQNERESLFIVLDFAKEYFKDLLWNNQEGKGIGLSYFLQRGFTEEIIKDFDLGYSLDKWDALHDEALEKGYNPDILEKSGLIIRKEDGSSGRKVYDRFRGRVVFPIHNVTGKVIAFGARILTKDKKQPKYINSPETEIYHKSKVLYGVFQARQAIRQQNNCYLVEGYTDVISMHMAGVQNVVASSGTSLTEDQIKLISRYTENITVLFDGDAAGIKASLRGIDMLLAGGLNVKAITFPEGEDPDSYAQKLGSKEFGEYLNANAKDFIAFKTQLFADDAKFDPIKKAESIKEIISSIAKIPDSVKKAVYIKESSSLLEIDEEILFAELNKIQLKQNQDSHRKLEREKFAETATKEALAEQLEDQQVTSFSDIISLQEKESIRLLINYANEPVNDDYRVSDYLFEELNDVEFKTPVYKKIFELFQARQLEGKKVSAGYLLDHGSEDVKQEVIGLVANRYDISSNWENKFQILVPREEEILPKMVFTNILRLKFRIIQKMIADNMEELKQVSDQTAEEKHLRIHAELKKSEMEIAKGLGNVTT